MSLRGRLAKMMDGSMMDGSMNEQSPSVVATDDRIPPQLVRVAVVAGLGSLLLNLSTTTLNVALDKLIVDLHTSLDLAQWSLTGYLLALTLVLPLFRWASERVGVRRLYLASLVGFTISSGLCAVAWSIESLIVFRVIQGAVGGLLTPIAQALTAQHAGERHMGRLLSIVAVPVLVAPLLGPVVGGLLVSELSWRWIFLLNVPLGFLCTALCARHLPADEVSRAPGARLDFVGLSLLSPGMALVIYGISNLRRAGGHAGAATTAAPFVVAAALLGLFVLYARPRPERALLDLRLFRERTVSAALATYVLSSMVSFGGQLLLPLFYQQVRGQSPLWAGVWLAPQGLGMILTMPRIGRLSDRYDPGKLAIGGVILTLLGTIAFTQATEETSMGLLALSLVVRGAGLGATNNPVLAAVYRHLPKREVANATTALNIVQRMGAPLGTASMAVFLQWRGARSPPKGEAFRETFSISVAFSLLTLVSAAFLVGAGARSRSLSPLPTEARRPS